MVTPGLYKRAPVRIPCLLCRILAKILFRDEIQAARKAKSDADASELIARLLASDNGSMPALTDGDCSTYNPIQVGHYLTAEEIEEKLACIKEWAELVFEAEGVMEAQKALCADAGLIVPAHCTHRLWGLRSPEQSAAGGS